MRKLFDPRRETAIQQQLLLRAERPLRRRLTGVISGAYKDAARAIENGLLAADIGVAAHTGDLRKTLYVHGDITARAFAKRLKGQLKSSYPTHMKALSDKERRALQEAALAARLDFAPAFEGAMSQFLLQHVATRVTQVNDTTKAGIRRVIQNGLENGDNLIDIAKALNDKAAPMSAYRASLIARTETHTSANAGQQAEAESTGMDMRKQWLSVRDDRTRGNKPTDQFDHVEMNMQTEDVNGLFDVQGEMLEYPGDPSGHPATICNCRCCVGYIVL